MFIKFARNPTHKFQENRQTNQRIEWLVVKKLL